MGDGSCILVEETLDLAKTPYYTNENKPLKNCASVPVNNNRKSRLVLCSVRK